MLQQDFKNLDRLPLQLQPNAISAQLPALRIEFEGAESVGLLLAHGHTTPPGKHELITAPKECQ
jgi:hypothetical protein